MGMESALNTATLGLSGVYKNVVKAPRDAAKAQERAARAAVDAANLQASAADQAANKANSKRPDSLAFLEAARLSGAAGGASTLLTGAGGIDPSALTLGKNTLLGM